MSTHNSGFIPTDSLVIGRKVMGGSSSTLSHEIDDAVRNSGINASSAAIRENAGFTVDLVDRTEFATRKLGHPVLKLWSTRKLVDDFNADIQRTPLTDYISDVGLGETDYREIREGKIAIGFMLSEEFRTKMLRERREAIDVLLDSTDIGPTDSARSWRMEDEDSLWLPVASLETTDPSIDDMANTFCDALEVSTASTAVDLFETKARNMIVDIPVPNR